MAHFSDLPLDLLPFVLDRLSKREYNSLIRVCKALHKEVTPYLYQDITFTARNSRGCARRLALLLRTLLERPQLAAHVSALRLYGTQQCWNKENIWPENRDNWTVKLWGLEDVTILSQAQMILASNQFYQLVDEEMHKSPEQFRGRSKDALAILVLTRFTQLTTLDIGDGFLVHSLFLPQILKRANRLFPKLSNIRFGDKKLESENTVTYMDLDLIRPVFYLPTVKTFEWTMSQPWRFEWKKSQPPRSESLTTLHLFRTNINRVTLGQLLAGTTNLRTFHYEHEIPFNKTNSWSSSISQFLNLNGLNSALSHVANTLEECKLSLGLAPGSLSPDEIIEAGWQFPPIQGTLTVLKGMKNLTKVEIPMVMLMGWFPDFAPRLEEVLPGGITHLFIRDDLVSCCPWAVGFDCNKKVGLVGEYVEGRSVHAPQLYSFKIRLTAAKNDYWLYHAVKALGAPISGEEVNHYFTNEPGMETHFWRFDKINAASRKDSVMTGTFLSM
ncbi:hypothetical protein K505DRAFT_320458 [Melanomma pulvis-pyrius CBS 109.77]|uniref:F-box domain-containing protein n=1 Tax=Melanomma pulvis-pyrius CBS 109.77 TaxID=1314802 RepID=A0A6A6XXZ4_9PLEO|nr:hypothetical protein K505DRAFT_320458 [Melanomma pulvis-pyrius CBS 109.77]